VTGVLGVHHGVAVSGDPLDGGASRATSEDQAGKSGRSARQCTTVFQHEPGEFLGGIVLARFKPMHGNPELRSQLAERGDAGSTLISFDPADVGVRHALARKLALAQAQRAPTLSYPFTD